MNYRDYYLLSFFNVERSTSSAQLLHIFQGKRTPSMFYLAEVNGWHHAFLQFKYVSVDEIEKVIQELLQNDWIISKDKGYVITQKGLSVMEAFFEDHYYPNVHCFTNLTIRKSFWDRYQLFVQSFSEMSYRNKQYSPVIKHPQHQENVRLLFQQFPNQKKELLKNWIIEQKTLFEQLEENRANVLAVQLSGHHKIGETKSQMQEQMNMGDLEYFFYHQDTIEDILSIIQSDPETFVLLGAIVQQLHEETNFGLSSSTKQSYDLLKEGYDISSIAGRRHLKENTIREHILEMAFVFNDFSSTAFIPDTIYTGLLDGFKKNDTYTYSDAREEFKDLEFMYYRLVELERMRGDE